MSSLLCYPRDNLFLRLRMTESSVLPFIVSPSVLVFFFVSLSIIFSVSVNIYRFNFCPSFHFSVYRVTCLFSVPFIFLCLISQVAICFISTITFCVTFLCFVCVYVE